MTRIGKKLCILCGRESRETVFYSSNLTTSFFVEKSLSGRCCLRAKSTGQEVASVQLSEKPALDRDSGEIVKITGRIFFKGSNAPRQFTLRYGLLQNGDSFLSFAFSLPHGNQNDNRSRIKVFTLVFSRHDGCHLEIVHRENAFFLQNLQRDRPLAVLRDGSCVMQPLAPREELRLRHGDEICLTRSLSLWFYEGEVL